MKITSIDVMLLTMGSAATSSSPWNPVVLRVNTDEGISGYGEMGLTYGKARNAAYGMAQDFSSLIIGMDPFDSEKIFEKQFRNTFWGQGGGALVFSAMSAVDIALWDIKGKALNQPVYKLLGGKTNPRLRAYASQIQFGWGKESKNLVYPEEYAEVTREVMAEGYDCVKVDPVGFDENGVWRGKRLTGLLDGKQLALSANRVAAVREAGGPDLDIIIELHSMTDANSAIQLAHAIEPYRCFYYEEPTTPIGAGNIARVARNIQIPVASGERIFGARAYRAFLEQEALQIVQPDIGNTGGFSEAKKICDLAAIYDVGVQMHVCGSPLATAATLQLEAVIPNFVIHEHHAAALLDVNRRSCLFDYQPINGYFEVPDRPGIGQEPTQEAIDTAVTVQIQ